MCPTNCAHTDKGAFLAASFDRLGLESSRLARNLARRAQMHGWALARAMIELISFAIVKNATLDHNSRTCGSHLSHTCLLLPNDYPKGQGSTVILPPHHEIMYMLFAPARVKWLSFEGWDMHTQA